jgi:hypothetical protein
MTVGTGGLIHHSDLINLVRNTRYFYFRFTTQHPYNWAVPRPIEHATMMDYGLFELDMFRSPAAGSIWGASAAIPQAQQWRYMSPTPISTVGSAERECARPVPDLSRDHPAAGRSQQSAVVLLGERSGIRVAVPFHAAQPVRCQRTRSRTGVLGG